MVGIFGHKITVGIQNIVGQSDLFEKNTKGPNVENTHIVHIGARQEICWEIVDNLCQATGLMKPDSSTCDCYGHDNNHLHKIGGNHSPCPTCHGHDQDHQARHDNGGFHIKIENCGGHNCQTV